jgi:membrane protease YdiL (CAAX protease family)
MDDFEKPPTPTLGRRALIVELVIVYLLQLALVVALVQSDGLFGLGGNLHALVGVVFVLLPVIVLDRRDRPYARYGIAWGKPHVDLLYAACAGALIYPFIALGSPFVWGLTEVRFQLVVPPGFATTALVHLVVVALPEEFFYRGYVMGRLDDIFEPRFRLLGVRIGPGFVVQAALFALGHFLVDLNPGRLAVFFPALAFGWLRARRGTIGAAVAFHAMSNIFMELFRAGLGL